MEDAERQALAGLLDDGERARADRFRFPAHSRRFQVAHARLRQELAAVLQVQPAGLEFDTGEHGKPRIAGPSSLCSLEFNLSHSGSLGLVGWARGRAIGVDIEFWRAVSDEAALVRRYFSASEIAAYESLASPRRTRGFFNGWTRKEAYVKAVGRGLGLPLDSFDVSLDDDDARLLRPSAIGEDGRTWTLAALPLQEGVSAAVVLEGADLRIIPA